MGKVIDRVNNNKEHSVEHHLRTHQLFKIKRGHLSNKHQSINIDPRNGSRLVSKGKIRIPVLLNKIGIPHKEGSSKLQIGHSSEDKFTYVVSRADAKAVDNEVEGTLLVCGIEDMILFDPISRHSFLSPKFSKLIDVLARELEFILTVTTPVGKQVVCKTFYSSCAIKIGGVVLPANLNLLEMHDFDIILRLDWLARYHATMDCFHKTLTFKQEETPVGLMFQGERKNHCAGLISALKADRLLKSGCVAYLVFITEDKRSQWGRSLLLVNFQMFFQKRS